jgi:hypothetical protein
VSVTIVCTVLNGSAFVAEFLRSVGDQTHRDWQLLVRDDGSTDATVEIVERAARADPRIVLLHRGGPRLGLSGGFGWLLERVPPDARYVMFADADDVWHPRKVAHTLGAMTAAEAQGIGPVLVHTDLVVTDAALRVIHSSFWEFSGIDPARSSLRDVVVRNVVTGCAAMINRPLYEAAVPIPPEAPVHDWWCACVAAAVGRIVALPATLVLYRQHGSNMIGARGARVQWHELPRAGARAVRNTAALRQHLAETAAQAGAMLARFGERLSPPDRAFLAAYAKIPERKFLRRKIDVARFRLRPEQGLLRSLSLLLRA